MNISVIITSYNSFTKKNGSIETVLAALECQNEADFEIIVVDNNSSAHDYTCLQLFVERNKQFRIPIKVIRNRQNNIAAGRNLGVNNSKGDTVLFLDDDIILPKQGIIKQISELSETYPYGYSATREWTKAGWYEKNKSALDACFLSTSFEFPILVEDPIPEIRKKKNARHLVRTYFGCFGFARRSVLGRVGNWDEKYEGYGLEDDAIILALFLQYGRPVLLDLIHVVHIWHGLLPSNYIELQKNQQRFNAILHSKGIKTFHTGRLLYGEDEVVEYL